MVALAVQDLSFAYHRGGQELFGGLDHEFVPGMVTAVTGASGRGKSTLLYVLGLLLRPGAGRVLLDGQAAHELPDAARSRLRSLRFGFVFQDAALDASRPVIDSVVEPALYAGRRRREVVGHADELMDRLGVALRRDHRPGQISGGQAQRVALCRALVNDPAVVLADEPTGNLDHENAATVLEVLRTAAVQGRTVVIATHDPFVLECADRRLSL